MQFVYYLHLYQSHATPFPIPPPASAYRPRSSPTFFSPLSTRLSVFPTFSPVSRLYILHYLTFFPTPLIFFVYFPPSIDSAPLLPHLISLLLCLIHFLPLQSLPFFF